VASTNPKRPQQKVATQTPTPTKAASTATVTSATFDSLQLIEPVIQKHNLTLLETALRWCVHHSALKVMDGNDGLIIGVSSLKQLEGNLRDLEKGPLPEDVVQALDQAWLINKGTAPRYWHQTPPKA
jgi:aflatoxin B1 aldehyde reductase